MKKLFTNILTAFILVSLFGLAGCKKLSSFDYPPEKGTPYEIITNDATFSTFKAAVDRAGLANLFTSADAYTIFAPTNAALIASGYTVAQLQGMAPADLAVIIKNHIVAGAVDAKSPATLTALSGRQINLQTVSGRYFADGGDITNINVPTTGGYLNVINIALATQNTLVDAVKNYNNTTANATLTFLAAAITRASTGSTNFTAMLTGTDKYTLFAPTNAAFIEAGYASITAINAAAPDVLGNLLKYHIIAGAKYTAAFDSVPVPAINGNNIYFDRGISTTRSSLFLANGIMFGNVGSPNISAKNGVMHVLPRVLPTPLTVNTLERIQADNTLSLFYAALIRASTADPKFNFQALLSAPKASFTVFAVTNAGMNAAGFNSIADINAATPEALSKIIKFHIIPVRLNNINMVDNSTSTTLLSIASTGQPASSSVLTFTLTNGFKIKGPTNSTSLTVSPANIVTTNGVVNVIPGVLTP